MPLSEVKKLLKGAKISDITREQQVCVLHDTTSLCATLKTLAGRGILSAPVIQADGKFSSDALPEAEGGHEFRHASGEVVGFIDVRDILLCFLNGVDVEGLLHRNMLSKMSMLEEEGAKFCEKTIADLVGSSQDGDFMYSGLSKASLWEMVYTSMLHPERRRSAAGSGSTSAVHHRMAFFNKHTQITQVVSQSDIIRFMHTHQDRIAGALKVKVADVPGLSARPIVTLNAAKSAFEALVLMGAHDISAVAVIDDGGRLVGNFSMSEMRSIMAEHFGALALPVGEFLALEHGTEYAGYSIASHAEEEPATEAAAPDAAAPAREFARTKRLCSLRRASGQPGEETGQRLAYLTQDSTFGDLLDIFVRRRVHRVYMVDASTGFPIGVTTLTDVLFVVAGEQSSQRSSGAGTPDA